MERLFLRVFLIVFFVNVTIGSPANNVEVSALRAALDELGFSGKDITTMTERELVAALTELATKYVEGKKQNKALYYQILLGTREEIKHLERLLIPLLKLLPNPRSRYTRWMAIFVILSKHPVVAVLIKHIEEAGLSLHEFASEAQRFYGDDSSAVHGVRLPDISVGEMKKILAAHERNKPFWSSEMRLLTILIECDDIITNLWNSTKNEAGTKTKLDEQVMVDDEPRCIKLGRVNLPSSEFETKIKAFFHVTKNENIVSVVHMQQEWGQGFYQIEFDSVGQAFYGFSNHAFMLGETSPKFVYLTICNASEPLPYDGQMAHIDFH